MTLARGKSLNGYVIFKNPAGHPGKFVVRMRRTIGGEEALDATPVAVVESLEAARAAVENTDCMLCLPRGPHDEPGVVETWV